MRKTHLYTVLICLISSYVSRAQTPVANFKSDISSGCSPIVVNFQDLSTGNPTSWLWDFGNGGTSTKKDPSTTYFSPGTYTVTLTATNLNGSSTKQGSINVSDPPQVDFKWDKSTGCTPYKIQFTDISLAASGTANIAWNWDFGDGTQSTLQNPLHIYRISDNFTVTLRVTNDKGCSKTVTKANIINIIPGVVPSFNNSAPTVCSAPASVDFTNTSSGPGSLTYSWLFGDGGTSAAISPKHTYSASGKFTVSLAISSSLGCSDTLQKDVVIGGFKTDFVVPVICIGKNVKFIDSSAPSPVSSLWLFPDGATDTDRNPTHSFSTAGNLNVTLVNNYGTCSDSVTKAISVTASPIADFVSADTVKCQPTLTSNFTNKSNGTSYLWNFGDSATSTQANPSHNYTKFGTYSVSLVATNAQGCVDSIKKANYIRIQKPIITFPGLPQRGCIPYLASFDAAIDLQDKVVSYKWEFGDGSTSTLQKPTYTYTKRGNYYVTLTITTNTGCTETFTLKDAIKVGPLPMVDFTVDQTDVCASTVLQFKDLSTPVDSVNEWKWEFGDGGISGDRNPAYQFADTGTLDVKLTVFNNGCPAPPLTKKKLVHIKPAIARFEYKPDCTARQNYSFTDKSIDAKSWEWDFGDGSAKVTTQNPGVHIFPPGFKSYTVSLKVTNGSCDFTSRRVINIIDKTPDFTASSSEGCKPFNTHLIPSSPEAGSIKQYIWDFGNSSGVTAQDAYPIYTKTGNYDISLTTVDSFGCIDFKAKARFIRVNGPVANFGSINNQGCRGMTTTFDDSTKTDGIHPIVSWTWNFGDSVIQNFTAPPFQHTYDTIGNLDVVLEVKDSYGCVDSIRKKDFIKLSILKANWDVSRQTCPGSPISFSNYTPGTYTSIWDLGDGNTSTNASFSYAYADTGTFSIKLKVRDPIGCEDSLIRQNYVQVYNPKADFDANNFVSFCTPFEAKFTNTSTYFNDRLWDLSIATSRQENPSIYYTSRGTYTIKLKITSPGGCTDEISKDLQVFNASDATLAYAPTSGCNPLVVSFDAFTKMKASFTWDFGNGNVIDTTVNTIQHTYKDFGTFGPKLIFTAADDPNCKIPLIGPTPITVLGVKAKFGIDQTLYCDSGYVRISDSTTFNDPVTNYNWNYGDGTSSTNPNDTIHYYSNPGNYDVFLTVKTSNNCIDTLRSKPIKVVQSPLIHIDSDSIICAKERMRHAGIFDRSDTSAVRWSWQFPNGNNAQTQYPASQQYDSAGYFNIKTIVTNSSGCTDSDSIRILVNPLPNVTMPSVITMQAGFPVIIPAVYTSSVTGYTWLPDNNTLSCTDCPQPITTNTKFNTKYSVAFVDSNGCKNTGDVQVIVICKNANVFAPNTFSPNGDGSNDMFYIRGKGIERIKTLRIFNRWGEVVFEKKDFPVNDPYSGWNGMFKGNKPHPDVYIYQVEVFCDNSEIIRFEGNVALIQ